MKNGPAWSLVAFLALNAPTLQAQMMGGGRDVRSGREAMNERLANATPSQRAWLDAMRDERAGFRTVVQRMTLRAGARSYSLGAADVSESLAQVTYSLRRPGMKLRVAGGPLRFASGDSVSIAGITPVDARLDLARTRDSLRISLRAPSSPTTLSGAQVAALASVSTSTVDLSSVEFGTPGGVAARYARSHPLGRSGGVSAGLGVDYEPRPSSAGWSYWRGTTLRAGLGVTGEAGSSRVSFAVDVTRSFADSLAGRNLFQGGGAVLTRAGVATSVGPADAVLVDVSAFYFRPFSSERTDAASRRIPVGDFVGASAVGMWSVRDLLLTPVLVVSRESSHGSSGATTTSGSGWAVGSSLGLDVPIGRRFGLTPEVGYATGSLWTESGTVSTAVRRTTESLSGWWVAVDISVSF